MQSSVSCLAPQASPAYHPAGARARSGTATLAGRPTCSRIARATAGCVITAMNVILAEHLGQRSGSKFHVRFIRARKRITCPKNRQEDASVRARPERATKAYPRYAAGTSEDESRTMASSWRFDDQVIL